MWCWDCGVDDGDILERKCPHCDKAIEIHSKLIMTYEPFKKKDKLFYEYINNFSIINKEKEDMLNYIGEKLDKVIESLEYEAREMNYNPKSHSIKIKFGTDSDEANGYSHYMDFFHDDLHIEVIYYYENGSDEAGYRNDLEEHIHKVFDEHNL